MEEKKFFNKEAFLEEAKELVKAEGKEHLSDFVEDVALVGWSVIKLATKHTEGTFIDDMVVKSMDSTVLGLIDKIDGKVDIEKPE